MSSQRAKIGNMAVTEMGPHTILWGTMIHGFVARRQFSDVVTCSVVFRTDDGIARWMKIGRHGVFTPDQARQEAARLLRGRCHVNLDRRGAGFGRPADLRPRWRLATSGTLRLLGTRSVRRDVR